MATRRATPPASSDTPALVQLRSEDLGETRDFTPAHAQALLDYQESKGYTHWQPVEADASDAK